MSVPEAGQSAGRDERERDEYEQQQARVLTALMQGFCAARYRKADNTPCPIDQGLYLGSVGAAMNKEALKSLNITHILIVARSLNPTYPAEFTYKKIEGGHEDRHEKGPKTFARCIDGGEAGYYHCPNAARTNAAIDACPHYVICNMAGVNGNRTTVEIHKSRRRR